MVQRVLDSSQCETIRKDTNVSKLMRFYLFVFLSNLRIGFYFILLCWSALTLTNKIEVVGHMLLISSVTGFLCGPFLGPHIDIHRRRSILIFAQIFILFSISIPFIIYLAKWNPFYSLYFIAILNALGSALETISSDGIFQSIVSINQRRLLRARCTLLEQISLVIGKSSCGYCILYFDIYFTFFIVFIISVAALLSCLLLPNSLPKVSPVLEKSYWLEIIHGYSYFIQSRLIFILSLCLVLSFATAQLTNILLPAFIRDLADSSSDLYGLAESSWAVGGVITSIVIASLLNSFSLKYMEFLGIIFLGILAMFFSSLVRSPISLILIYGFMGASFAITRILCDGHILKLCPEYLIGRIRASTSSIINLVGAVIYITPTFIVSELDVQLIYKLWGYVLLIGGMGLFFFNLCIKYEIKMNNNETI